MVKKGWFKTHEHDGDRTIEQQLEGLGDLLAAVPGKTVLDVGCAEGLIDVKLAEAGATSVHGIDIVAKHIEFARRHAVPATKYDVGDAMLYPAKADSVDIVLLLALLHKLRDPVAVAKKFASAAREMVVLRMPPAGAVITDVRSGGKPLDIGAALVEAGWVLRNEVRGSFDEWIGYYVKPAVAVEPVAEPAESIPVAETKEVEAETQPADLETEAPFEKTIPISGGTRPAPTDSLPDDPDRETTVPPAESVHPAGDPTPQLPPDRIEMPPMDGMRRTTRRSKKSDET